MTLWKKDGGVTEAVAPAAVTLTASRLMTDLLAGCRRRAAAGEGRRVLALGPPSGQTIETFHGLGCRVTVAGEDTPSGQVEAADECFDLLLAFDVLDQLSDREARVVASEWGRVLRPGGAVYLLARQDKAHFPTPWRVDVPPDGTLRLHPLPALAGPLHPRQNREIEALVRPLTVRDIHLHRDGLREVLCRKA